MLNQKKIIVVLPAYNAALTLEKTYKEIPFDIVDEVIAEITCPTLYSGETSSMSFWNGII